MQLIDSKAIGAGLIQLLHSGSGQERKGVDEEGTTLANNFLVPPFFCLGLSPLIHKMEHLASMSSKALRCTRLEYSSLAAEASRDGMEPERSRGKPWLQDQEAPCPEDGGGGGGAESSEVSAVPSTPAIFTLEHWTARGLAKNTSGTSPEHPFPREEGWGLASSGVWGPGV